ncbi:hypothetical protein [Labrys wisconsinensis]|uniref:Membrane protein n=1 Tax=Labrys wisconsinensis TaxID=425677 RepID=A0ABU0JJ23_9HYPH|nr:hypothetical protein [Labrys wisconsinensis]MDQ0473132.1 putative membrane protein [Labrys wisconsinensis]
MSIVLVIALSLHVLSAVFWAGTSFVLARLGGQGGERLFRPQMGAAVIAVVTGGYLWHLLHEGVFEAPEQVLAFGAACAIAAAGVQGAVAGPAVRRLAGGGFDADAARARVAVAQRIAAGLLAAALVCMVVARYA